MTITKALRKLYEVIVGKEAPFNANTITKVLLALAEAWTGSGGGSGGDESKNDYPELLLHLTGDGDPESCEIVKGNVEDIINALKNKEYVKVTAYLYDANAYQMFPTFINRMYATGDNYDILELSIMYAMDLSSVPSSAWRACVINLSLEGEIEFVN